MATDGRKYEKQRQENRQVSSGLGHHEQLLLNLLASESGNSDSEDLSSSVK